MGIKRVGSGFCVMPHKAENRHIKLTGFMEDRESAKISTGVDRRIAGWNARNLKGTLLLKAGMTSPFAQQRAFFEVSCQTEMRQKIGPDNGSLKFARITIQRKLTRISKSGANDN